MQKYVNRLEYIFSKDCTCTEVIENALKIGQKRLLDDIIESGLRGRGGAGFPTGLKWKFASEQAGDEKYIVCNADEGEPGTFKDREILTQVPRKVFGGMTLAHIATGATKGVIYLRGEYKYLVPHLESEIAKYKTDIWEKFNLNFNITIFLGSGAYVCGEETALIESMEGKRGEPRNKPPSKVWKANAANRETNRPILFKTAT